jgi:thymidylate synthase
MNNIDQQYLTLLQDILDNGVEKKDRTGTGTRSVFGRQIRHKMSGGFPLLTTKKMAWKSIVVELLWFLRGDTNVKFLIDNQCNIWNGDAYKAYIDKWYKNFEDNDVIPYDGQKPLSKEEYIDFARNNSLETLKSVGGFDLGPIYGKQWRKWQGFINVPDVHYLAYGSLWYDQIARLIHDLKTNPDSRRLMVSAWNVADLDKMVLPPCHNFWQMYSVEKEGKRYLSIMVNIRSNDVPLGLPFNIASYALLLMLIAKEVDMTPDELIINIGDAHIYLNQIDGIKEQLTREPYPLPHVQLDFDYSYFDGYIVEWDKITIEQIKLVDYKSHPVIKMPISN